MCINPATLTTFQNKVEEYNSSALIQHITLLVLSTLALTSLVCCVGAFTGVIDSETVKWISFTTFIVSSVSIYVLIQQKSATVAVHSASAKEKVAAKVTQKNNALQRLPKLTFATLPEHILLQVNTYAAFPDMFAALLGCKRTLALRERHFWKPWAESLGYKLEAHKTQVHAAHYVKAFFGNDCNLSDPHWSAWLPERLHVYEQPKGIRRLFSAILTPPLARLRTALNIRHLKNEELPRFLDGFVNLIDSRPIASFFHSPSYMPKKHRELSDPYALKYLLTHYTETSASLDTVLQHITKCDFELRTPYFFNLFSIEDLRKKVTRKNQTLLQLQIANRNFSNCVLLIHAAVLKNFDFGRSLIEEIKQNPANFIRTSLGFFRAYNFQGCLGERILYGRSCGSLGFACALNQDEINFLLFGMWTEKERQPILYSPRGSVLVLNLLLSLTRLRLPQNHPHYPQDEHPAYLSPEECRLPPERLRQTQVYVCSYLERTHPHFLEELSTEWEKQPYLNDKSDLFDLLRADYIQCVLDVKSALPIT